jgi:hypothetical protein
MRKASYAVSGVVPQPGKVHTPANLMWVPVPDELVDATSFPGWADNVPVMFGCTGRGKRQVQQCPQCPVSDGRPEKGGLSLRAKALKKPPASTIDQQGYSPGNLC